MSYLNKVMLIGRVVATPESFEYKEKEKYVRFKIATNEIFKDKSGTQNKQTEFHSIIAFGKLADIVLKYVEKGKLVYVEGKIRTKEWEDEKTKQKTKIFSIFLDEIRFLSSQSHQEKPEVDK